MTNIGFLLSQGWAEKVESRSPAMSKRTASPVVIPAQETVQETPLGMRYMRKPLRVWLFYWVPAFAGTTNIEFLHSLASRNPVKCSFQNLTIIFNFPLSAEEQSNGLVGKWSF